MGTVADNIAVLSAYPLVQGDESDARLNVEKLRQIQPTELIATSRRILSYVTIGAPFAYRFSTHLVIGPAIAAS